ncbi:preprotein translocase subunit SecG [Candidatus Gracilibacteria bacterium]|nr:MAG: preprotein translocase subunit SecG [Candidatus Gracilibacteria bacterium]
MIYFISGLSIALIAIIMLQAKGNGLSIVPGSEDFGKFEKRGPEKILHNITIIAIVVYVATALLIYLTR